MSDQPIPAALAAARALRDAGEHVHYVASGQSICLSKLCVTEPVTP